MNYSIPAYRIFPLGDSALTIDYGNLIDEAINEEVTRRFMQLKAQPLPGMKEAVPAYSSLTLYYDITTVNTLKDKNSTAFEWMKKAIQSLLDKPANELVREPNVIQIPVCYEGELAPDSEAVAKHHNISLAELITIHSSRRYKVYMLGFQPGFSYLGTLDERLRMPRKNEPVMVAAGSIGIAASQTGIYPFASPGGWHIIGRTGIKLFDAANTTHPTLLQTGDIVQFYPITRYEFENH